MKILIALSYYLPNISGLTIYAKNLADGLTLSGHEVKILTSQHKKDLPTFEKEGNITIKRIPISFFVGKGPVMLTYPFKIYGSLKNADVVNCHLPQFESFILILGAKLMRKKVILTYHCDLALENGLFNKIIRAFLFFSHLFSALLADVIVSQTEDYAKCSPLLSLFSRKLVFIYPPVCLPRKRGKRNIHISQRSFGQAKYVIGMVARISQEKGIEYLIKTIPLLKENLSNDFVILLAGPRNPIGEEKYWKSISGLFQKYRKNIFYLDTLNSDGLNNFYSKIDILVLSSINSAEAFGMVQIEAMMAGVPVIAPNMPGVRIPITRTGMGELFEKANAQSLAATIMKVINNREKYIKSCRSIQKMFACEKVLQNYEKILT